MMIAAFITSISSKRALYYVYLYIYFQNLITYRHHDDYFVQFDFFLLRLLNVNVSTALKKEVNRVDFYLANMCESCKLRSISTIMEGITLIECKY